MNEALSIPRKFREVGISEETFKNDFEELVENSLKGSTVTNPLKITKQEMEELLNRVY